MRIVKGGSVRLLRIANEIRKLNTEWVQLKTDMLSECDRIIAAAGAERDVIRNDTTAHPRAEEHSPAAPIAGRGIGTGDPTPSRLSGLKES